LSAQPKIDQFEDAKDPNDARAVERKQTKGSVLVQNTRGDRCIARLRDISTYGCNLLTDAEWLRAGNFVSIRLGAERTIQAVVRWSRDGASGVEFLRPIAEAEAERIAQIIA
jgi:PilZ domain